MAQYGRGFEALASGARFQRACYSPGIWHVGNVPHVFFNGLLDSIMNGDFWISTSVCLALVVTSVWLIRRHFRVWREMLVLGEVDPLELKYHRRQCRRRVQSSAMIGLVGLLILIGHFMRPPVSPLLAGLFWIGVILLVGWTGLLALLDMLATRLFYAGARQTNAVEQVRLKAALRRAESVGGNGKTEGRSPDEPTKGAGTRL